MRSGCVYIVILNWNGWQDTLTCLESVFRNDYPCFRVVVCDNASTDGSVARLKDWANGGADQEVASAYPRYVSPPVAKPISWGEYDRAAAEEGGDADARLVLINTGANLGFAGGVNVGIRHALARGAEFVWLLNNDAVIEPQALSAMVAAMRREPAVGMVGSVIYDWRAPHDVQVWGGGQVNLWLGAQRMHLAPVPQSRLHFLTGASLLLRSAALAQSGLFDEHFFMYWEDADLCVRLRALGWRAAVAEDSKLMHKKSASFRGNRQLLYGYCIASVMRFFSLHAPVPRLALVLGLGGRLLKCLVTLDGARLRAMFSVVFCGASGARAGTDGSPPGEVS